MIKTNTYTFLNGIRLLHVQEHSPVAYAGIVINTGTRDEDEDEAGYAHLAEHMFFKGTSKRTSNQIINRIEDVGGELNAFTAKEETVVYSIFLQKHLSLAVGLISDIVFDSIFNELELEKEVEVVIDEIHSYMDTPSELIVDDFEDELFEGYTIGRNILGTEESLKNVSKERLLAFVKRTYTTDQMVFFVMGDFSFEKVIHTVGKFISKIPSTKRLYKRTAPLNYTPKKIEKDKKTLQAHYMLGTRALTVYDNNRFILHLLNNILGGQGMNSRFNMVLREKNGLVYTVESHFTPYSDTGTWSIYFGTDHDDVKKSLKLIYNEIERFKENPLTPNKLQKAKTQLLAQMVIAGENKENWIISKAKQYMLCGTLMEQSEIEVNIQAITSDDLCMMASSLLSIDSFTHLRYF